MFQPRELVWYPGRTYLEIGCRVIPASQRSARMVIRADLVDVKIGPQHHSFPDGGPQHHSFTDSLQQTTATFH